jgi:hypothetical protein
VKTRVPAAILLAMSLLLAACGGDSDDDAAGRLLADEIEQSGTDGDTTDGADAETDDAGTDDAGSDDDADADAGADSDDRFTDSDTDTDSTMPDLDDLGECMEVSFAYAGLALASLGGAMGGEELSDADMAELKDTIAELQGDLPNDIQDDFAVVADAYNELFEKGWTSGDAQAALESDEFTEASENVQAYIDELCA